MVLFGKYVKGKKVGGSDWQPLKGEAAGGEKLVIKFAQRQMAMRNQDEVQKLRDLKRDKLKKDQVDEQKTAYFNRMKILTHWRKVMRVAKTEALKKEIQIFQQNHDREVDAKDAILQMLDRDLEEAEEQYQMALRNHLIHVDQLIELQHSRLEGLHEQFMRDLAIIKDEFDLEKEDIKQSHEQERNELTDLIETMQEDERQKERDLKDRFDGIREEIKNENMEDMDSMRNDLLKKFEELDNQFELQFNRYVTATSSKSEQYRDNLNTNETHTIDIDTQIRNMTRLKEKIQYWKAKIQQNSKECLARNHALRKEKESIANHYQDLKNKMTKFRDEEGRRLANLTGNSKSCMDKLNSYRKLGEKILKTAELCRKLETEKEKVLPFFESTPESLEEPPFEMVEKIEGLRKGVYGDFTSLDSFWKRYNKVLLDKLAIANQKSRLDKENLFFKSLLKQYLDGVSVNDDVMGANNPLLVVNNKVSLNRPPVERVEDRRPVVEGVFEVTNRAMQLNPR